MKKILLTLCLLISSLFAFNAKSIVDSVCYACHGSQMEQSCYGVSKVPNVLSSSDILKALKGYKSGEKSDYGMGAVMNSQVGSLSHEELKALAEYIPTLR